jgi:glycosyltransferase involved in cell wall biosynthesis
MTTLSRASTAAWQAESGRAGRVLAPGVRLDRFTPALEPRTGPPKVLFSADAGDRRKGIRELLLAFGGVLDRFPDARLQISSANDWTWALTDGTPVESRVVDAVESLGAGTLEDVPGRYRAATVTVLPSRGEAFGLALVESLASGTPVVCNDDGGMPDIVSDPAIGRVVRAEDPAALGTGIADMIDLARDPATPARCVAHARRWDWDASIGPAHEAIYRELAP